MNKNKRRKVRWLCCMQRYTSKVCIDDDDDDGDDDDGCSSRFLQDREVQDSVEKGSRRYGGGEEEEEEEEMKACAIFDGRVCEKLRQELNKQEKLELTAIQNSSTNTPFIIHTCCVPHDE